MTHATIPRSLQYRGGRINHAGRGQAPGSHAYLDATTGRVLHLYFAKVVKTGPLYSLATVSGNHALPLVRIDHVALNGKGPVWVGEILLIGPLCFCPQGPKAENAWHANVLDSNRVARCPTMGGFSPRRTGTITIVKSPTWAFLTRDGDGQNVFVHVSQLQGSVPLAPRQRVTYEEVHSAKGPMAIKVRPL